MKEYILALDLGTTNVKAGIYDKNIDELSISTEKIDYKNSGLFVEFNADEYWQLCKMVILNAIEKSRIDSKSIISISLTGQAETLVILDKNYEVIGDAISWMDNRSKVECEILKNAFNSRKSYMITGQPEITTTWPITKILWIRNNQNKRFKKASKFLLLKDFIIFKLTKKFVSDLSIACFSYYLDVVNKRYWDEIIDYVGFSKDMLPNLVEPGDTLNGLTSKAAKELNLSKDIIVNVGMLDHFAGMIGVGNIKEGIISESTGTVMAMAAILEAPKDDLYPIPFHCGPFNNSYSLLPVCESGGICYEWFRDNFYPDLSFRMIEEEIVNNYVAPTDTEPLIFLPYILGTNSPEYDKMIKGIFYGVTVKNKRPDFARAVMEGIGFLLKKNIDFLKNKGLNIRKVISFGGGSKSKLWNQIKADILQKDITIPKYKESTLYGASVIAASKIYDASIEDFTNNILLSERVTPDNSKFDHYDSAYKKFQLLYGLSGNIYGIK